MGCDSGLVVQFPMPAMLTGMLVAGGLLLLAWLQRQVGYSARCGVAYGRIALIHFQLFGNGVAVVSSSDVNMTISTRTVNINLVRIAGINSCYSYITRMQ